MDNMDQIRVRIEDQVPKSKVLVIEDDDNIFISFEETLSSNSYLSDLRHQRFVSGFNSHNVFNIGGYTKINLNGYCEHSAFLIIREVETDSYDISILAKSVFKKHIFNEIKDVPSAIDFLNEKKHMIYNVFASCLA